MLERFHKQKIDKKTRQHYVQIGRKYHVNFDKKLDKDILMLSVFEKGMYQKQLIEETYEKVRSEAFDMWDYLSFKERNKLVAQELTELMKQMVYFEYENTQIVIPFFNRLLNSLYVTETAILELPQYFELYRNFNEKIIPIDTYGIAVYKAG